MGNMKRPAKKRIICEFRPFFNSRPDYIVKYAQM